jgi:hypothetical protein
LKLLLDVESIMPIRIDVLMYRVIASNFTSGIKSMDCHTWSIPDLFSN